MSPFMLPKACRHLNPEITARSYLASERLRRAHVQTQAQTAQFAAVWLWNVGIWTPAGAPLEAHSLTVTQMAFSHSGQQLLTVSRDRTLAIFQRSPEGASPLCTSLCYLKSCAHRRKQDGRLYAGSMLPLHCQEHTLMEARPTYPYGSAADRYPVHRMPLQSLSLLHRVGYRQRAAEDSGMAKRRPWS
jgi:hypothetical protein